MVDSHPLFDQGREGNSWWAAPRWVGPSALTQGASVPPLRTGSNDGVGAKIPRLDKWLHMSRQRYGYTELLLEDTVIRFIFVVFITVQITLADLEKINFQSFLPSMSPFLINFCWSGLKTNVAAKAQFLVHCSEPQCSNALQSLRAAVPGPGCPRQHGTFAHVVCRHSSRCPRDLPRIPKRDRERSPRRSQWNIAGSSFYAQRDAEQSDIFPRAAEICDGILFWKAKICKCIH